MKNHQPNKKLPIEHEGTRPDKLCLPQTTGSILPLCQKTTLTAFETSCQSVTEKPKVLKDVPTPKILHPKAIPQSSQCIPIQQNTPRLTNFFLKTQPVSKTNPNVAEQMQPQKKDSPFIVCLKISQIVSF